MAYKPKYDMTLDISVLGDKELDAQLRRLAGQGRSRIFGASAKKAMRPVLLDVRKRTPVLTGALKKGWKFGQVKTMSARRSGGYVGARIVFPRRKDIGIAADAKGYYPASLEFGFEHRSGKKIPAVMMVRKALYGNRTIVFNTLKTELRTRIALAMRKKGMSVPEGFGE
jgi:hypothetical protein